jgi:2,4-dienoyl-CoA reductase-like NADH-dependent reductase (Old Yellow Enzyme family)
MQGSARPRFLEPFTFPRKGQNPEKTARNRVVLAAMTNTQSNPDGTLGEDEYRWLLSRARGGFGVVSTCAAHVALDGQGWPGELGVFDDKHVPGLRRLATDLRGEGALTLVQIFHGGVKAPSRVTGQQPWSASEYESKAHDFERPRAATEADVERVIGQFVDAARRSAEAGFEGVELHGAHGYLFSQFLGRISNTRTDRWGGAALEHRARLMLETVDAIRARVPADFLVGMRLSPAYPADQGANPEDNLQVARWLVERGIDFLHISNLGPIEGALGFTRQFRDAIGAGVPLMVCGSINTPVEAEAVMEQGADFVALARAAIANPSWPRDAAQAGWEPTRLPLTPAELRERVISERYIEYMRSLRGFGIVRDA